jgi:Outer membrane protein beta-barrel domain
MYACLCDEPSFFGTTVANFASPDQTGQRMKKILLTLVATTAVVAASAQFQVNPQAGLTFQNLTAPGPGQNFKAALGWTLGADLRLGDKLFFQPGAFLSRNTTSITIADTTVTKQELDFNTTNLRLRALVGYRVIDTYQFDLRVFLGPSYDLLLNKQLSGYSSGNFKSGSFNIEAGVGLDMGMVTLSPTMTFGLSNVFNDNPNIQAVNSKYFTYGLTVGINIGDDDAAE